MEIMLNVNNNNVQLMALYATQPQNNHQIIRGTSMVWSKDFPNDVLYITVYGFSGSGQVNVIMLSKQCGH